MMQLRQLSSQIQTVRTEQALLDLRACFPAQMRKSGALL